MAINTSLSISLSIAEWLNRFLISLGLKSDTRDNIAPPAYVDSSDEHHFSILPEQADLSCFVDENSNTSFHIAAKNGDFELMKLLCEEYEKNYGTIALESILNTQNKDGETVLYINCYTNTGSHYSSPKDNLENGEKIAELLIKKGADINATSIRDNKLTTLELLARFRYSTEIFKVLISTGVKLYNAAKLIDYLPEMFNSDSVNSYSLDVIKLLIEKGLIKSTDIDILIERICSSDFNCEDNSRQKIEVLLGFYKKFGRTRAELINKHKFLFKIAGSNDIELIKELCNTPDVNLTILHDHGYSLLYVAAQKGNLALIKYLIEERGVDPNVLSRKGETALYAACQHNRLEVAEYLISKGANPNIGCIRGSTPLSRAIDNEHLKCVKLLIENGAKNCPKETIYHAMFRAAQNMDKELIVLLTEKLGANINSVDSYGCSVLFKLLFDIIIKGKSMSQEKEIIEFAKFLVSKRADINCQTPKWTVYNEIGDTILHIACEYGDLEVVKFLISLRIDTSICNFKGQTALDIAKERRHENIVDYLTPPSYQTTITHLPAYGTLIKTK